MRFLTVLFLQDVFGVFSTKVKRIRGTVVVSRMLTTVAEMGYSPPKAHLERVLDHLLSYRNRFACTSSELVKTIHALSEFEER